MKLRVFASLVALAVCVCVCGSSCRREKVESTAGKNRPAVSNAVSIQSKIADTNLLAAAGRLYQAERAWLAQTPEAAIALKRRASAQAAYEGLIGKLGLYTVPAQDRDAKMRLLIEAREKGDATRIAKAEQDLVAANDRAEQGAARLRSGNPSIQKAYDEWLAARQAYEELRNREETISRASAEMTRLMEKQNLLDQGEQASSKEN
jgi:hypothetical protein